jgi:hypothetical protein
VLAFVLGGAFLREVVILYRGRTGRPRLETGGFPMTTITSTAALVLAEPVFSD